MKNSNSKPFGGSSLNTLAQNGTNNLPQQAVIISGQGSELDSEKVLKGRAKRKMISQVMSLNLLDIANKREDFERSKSFWNTFHCQERLYSHEDRYYGKYCKNRFCPLCCSVRKAVIINRYIPVLSMWNKPYFVTLTVKAVKKERLNIIMEKMIAGLRRIVEKYRKRHQRGKSIKLVGIKSLECNFNPVKKTYNPHFHIIVEDKEMADILVQDWLKLWTGRWATKAAQFIRPVNSLEKDLIEIIKYGSKIFTEPDIENKVKKKGNAAIHAKALYNIFEAMKRHRIFDRFGFDLPKAEKKVSETSIVSEYFEWFFAPKYHDWLNTENELVLSAYIPDKELKNLLEYGIDTNAE